jgi:hypothetical protein
MVFFYTIILRTNYSAKDLSIVKCKEVETKSPEGKHAMFGAKE